MAGAFIKLPNNALGANVEELEALAQQMNQTMEQVEQAFQTVDTKMSATTWSGPDATKAESDWNTTRTTMTNQLRQLFEQLGQAFRSQAQQQTTTSAS